MTVSRHQATGAYPRWEPPSFDEHEAATDATPDVEPEPAPAPPPPVVDPPPEAPSVALPTAQDIEQMFEQGRADGHAEGFAAGHEEGSKKGFEEARQEAAKLAELVGNMDEALSAIEGDVAEDIVVLAVELARQMIKHTLADHPAAVIDTVREALQQLPQNEIKIHLNPDDAELVREHLGDTIEHGHHRIVPDEAILRGGCRLETSGSELDATMETRWRRVLEGLGRPNANWGDEEP